MGALSVVVTFVLVVSIVMIGCQVAGLLAVSMITWSEVSILISTS